MVLMCKSVRLFGATYTKNEQPTKKKNERLYSHKMKLKTYWGCSVRLGPRGLVA